MTDETARLSELMLQADVFCCRVEANVNRLPKSSTHDQLRLKIGQCRGVIARLQERFEDDALTVRDRSVAADFRHLVMALLWVSFEGGSIVDRQLFRKVVQVESGFTYLLIANGGQATDRQAGQT